MNRENVTLKVGFLLKTLIAESANVFRRLAALVFQVAFQTALVPVGPTAVARERLEQLERHGLICNFTERK